jgi:undecaprenyl-diphosphatase
MLDKILSLDTELLIFLNGLGERFDSLWLIITNNSTGLLFFLLFFLFIKLGIKQTLYFLSAIAV